MDNTTYFNKNIQVTLRSITTQYKILQQKIQVKYYNKIFQQKYSPDNTTYFNKDIQVTTQNISVPGA